MENLKLSDFIELVDYGTEIILVDKKGVKFRAFVVMKENSPTEDSRRAVKRYGEYRITKMRISPLYPNILMIYMDIDIKEFLKSAEPEEHIPRSSPSKDQETYDSWSPLASSKKITENKKSVSKTKKKTPPQSTEKSESKSKVRDLPEVDKRKSQKVEFFFK